MYMNNNFVLKYKYLKKIYMHKTIIIICERKIKYQTDILEKFSFLNIELYAKTIS